MVISGRSWNSKLCWNKNQKFCVPKVFPNYYHLDSTVTMFLHRILTEYFVGTKIKKTKGEEGKETEQKIQKQKSLKIGGMEKNYFAEKGWKKVAENVLTRSSVVLMQK